VPTVASLAVIVAALSVTTIASVVKSKRDPVRRAHAGALRQGADRDEAPDANRPDPPGSDEVKPTA
jgi:tellurite resistance protein TerC